MKFVSYLCIFVLIFCQCRAFLFDLFEYDDDDKEVNSSKSVLEELCDEIVGIFLPEDSETEKLNLKGTTRKPISPTTESFKENGTSIEKADPGQTTQKPVPNVTTTSKENGETFSDGKSNLSTTALPGSSSIAANN